MVEFLDIHILKDSRSVSNDFKTRLVMSLSVALMATLSISKLALHTILLDPTSIEISSCLEISSVLKSALPVFSKS